MKNNLKMNFYAGIVPGWGETLGNGRVQVQPDPVFPEPCPAALCLWGV